ncbi:MAG: hypothetical protein FWH22_08180, partial [Fibromonadales bacterium]|nr:hypothetical protein [Fibromonadales bacterium]
IKKNQINKEKNAHKKAIEEKSHKKPNRKRNGSAQSNAGEVFEDTIINKVCWSPFSRSFPSGV